MFTGLIEEIGRVTDIEEQRDAKRLTIHAPLVVDGVGHGDSIAVNGCCLTVAEFTRDAFVADVMAESLARTNLGQLRSGDSVNLERAVRVDQRLGGHVVQGHIDDTATLIAREASENWEVFRFRAPAHLMRYLVPKGSIAVDGTSLTVVDVADAEFSVSLILTTLQDTILGALSQGAKVNIEVDVLAKYVERLLP